MRIREIAQTRVRYEYQMIRVLLNREGFYETAGSVKAGFCFSFMGSMFLCLLAAFLSGFYPHSE
jgi:tetrahydromethanopterin S-methyltransferase subunit B